MLWLDDLARDVRFASRSFLRNPGFAFVAAASLALATGATTAIFSIVYGVLLRPLPLGNPDQLVQVYGSWREDRRGPADEIDDPLGSIEIETYSTQSRLVAAFAGYSVTTRHLQRANGTERLTAVVADLTFFTLLNVETIAGRTFREGDGQDVAVISAGLWEQRFARDPAVVGSTVTLNGRPCTVLGVMPDTFQFPYTAASLLPGALPESRPTSGFRSHRFATPVPRLVGGRAASTLSPGFNPVSHDGPPKQNFVSSRNDSRSSIEP